MHGGHQALCYAKVIVQDLRKRCQAICCAGRVRDNSVVRWIVFGMIYTHHIDWHGILWWCRDDDTFSSTLNMELSLGLLSEDTCGLTNILSSCLSPSNGGRILLVVHADLLTVDDEEVVATIAFGGN